MNASLLLFVIALTSCAMGAIAWWLAVQFSRLGQGSAGEGDERGWVLDFARMLGAMVLNLFPRWSQELQKKDAEMLEKAGLYPTWDCEELVGLQIISTLFFVIIASFLFQGNNLMLCIFAGVGVVLPRWYAKSKRNERQFDLLCAFPTAIDMMVLGLEGGLDIASGIKETLDNADPGPLREELERLHTDMAMGISRQEAFRRMSKRVDPIEIRTVLISLIQAIDMGSELGPLLKVQSEQLRFNRLNRAEEAANKAPTKMMIPMALFILPCMFLVIFAPIILSVWQTVKGL